MNAQQLLEELRHHTYITLKASPVHGIGVFAVCPIPKGCRDIFSPGTGEWIKLPIAEVEQLPAPSRDLVETYCLFDEENYFVPGHGFRIIDPVIYLNHSSQPNLLSIDEGDCFEALRDIAPGEELFVDYGTLVEGMESYNE